MSGHVCLGLLWVDLAWSWCSIKSFILILSEWVKEGDGRSWHEGNGWLCRLLNKDILEETWGDTNPEEETGVRKMGRRLCCWAHQVTGGEETRRIQTPTVLSSLPLIVCQDILVIKPNWKTEDQESRLTKPAEVACKAKCSRGATGSEGKTGPLHTSEFIDFLTVQVADSAPLT